MPRRPSNRISFLGKPVVSGLVLSENDYQLIVSAIGPCHGGDIERFLAAVTSVPGGRAIDIYHPLMDDVLGAVGIEVRGYMRLDEERDGQERMKPKKGSTAERLLAIYKKIESHLQ
jgi:hypothetical protein